MPLKPIDTYPSGGVDSRSNPVNMPVDRYLRVCDFWPQQDGSIRLRDGYSLLKAGTQPGVPIHSLIAVTGPGPTCTPLIVFWQAKVPYVYDTGSGNLSSPTIKGTAIASGARWCYFYTNGKLYAYNGTDAKWFDGVYWRDTGLPTLSAEQLANIVVTEGMASITPTEAGLVTLTVTGGGGWVGTMFPASLYLAFFDMANNVLASSATKLGTGTPPTPTTGDKVDLANLPTRTPSTVVGLVGFELVPGKASFVADGVDQEGTMASTGTTVTVTSTAPHGLTTGDVVTLVTAYTYTNHTVAWPSNGPFAVTVTGASTFTFESPDAPLYVAATAHYLFIKLLALANGATSYSLTSNVVVASQGTQFSVNGENLLPYVNGTDALGGSFGLPAVDLTMAEPGYQFYASIYNPTTGHVGNRQKVGVRLANASDCLAAISGLPDLSGIDAEWVLLIGRTSMGAQIPYAIMETSGAWVYVPSGITAITIAQAKIDGNAELPSRNFPPPGTLDYEDQVNLLPGDGSSI